jgi:hypothetical protein
VFRAAPPEAFNAGNYKNKNLPPRKRGKYDEKEKILNTPSKKRPWRRYWRWACWRC